MNIEKSDEIVDTSDPLTDVADNTTALDPLVPHSDPSPEPAEKVDPPSTDYDDEDVEAASSPATEDKKTLLDVVQAASKPEPDPTEPDAVDPEDDGVAQAQAEKAEDDQSDTDYLGTEEFKDLKPKHQRRISKLVSQVKERERELDGLRPYQDFVTKNDLSEEDVSRGLNAMALLRQGNMKGFLEAVGPYVRHAQEYTGVVLPVDLEEQVLGGHMTTEVAQRMARQNADIARQSQEAQLTAQRQEQERQAVQAATIKSAVEVWEANTVASDPDFATKAEVVSGFITQARALGEPKTPEEAVALVDTAYRRASEIFRKNKPTPVPTDPVPSGLNSSSNPAASEPKTMLELVSQVANAGRR